MRIYAHTNVPSPYRKHQFELMAKAFPGSRFYFHMDQMGYRSWSNSLEDWPKGCRRCGLFVQLRDLLVQPWGTVHLLAGASTNFFANLVFVLALQLSAAIGHSKVFSWNDAGFPDKIVRSRHSVFRMITRMSNRLFSAYSPGILGRKFTIAQGYAESRIVNCYFSHDVQRFCDYRRAHYDEDRKRIRTLLGIRDSSVSILNISRYLECKRLGDLAQAFTWLEAHRPEVAAKCEFVLIGHGEHQEHLPMLEKLSLIKVHLVKTMPPDELLAYYCANDLFVFPSDGDIWGLVVNEALSMGLPVIVNEVIGSAEVVHDGKNGYRVPTHRPDAIANRIAELVEDESKRKKFAENAKTIEQYWRTELGIEELKKYLAEEKI